MLYGIHVWLCLLITVAASKPGDMSSFFLKAPKSVPRAGRAAPGHYEGFFLKTSKSVPRVGRRNGAQNGEPQDSFYQQFLLNEHNYNAKDSDGDYRLKSKDDNLDNYFIWDPVSNNDNYYYTNKYQSEDTGKHNMYGDMVDQYNLIDRHLDQFGVLNENSIKE